MKKNLMNESGVQSPCLNCKDRFVGCHSTCEKYIAFTKENNKKKEEIRAEKTVKNMLYHYNKDKVSGIQSSKFRKEKT